ncbi:MAG: PIN domain-containing protein [Deltaproteobacteria bacterium]|nr:PIN domain-containing protein [Deltaproteobacteria bacterium]
MNGEKILIDTSVWIDYFKSASNNIVEQVDEILTNAEVYVPKSVIAELIQGAKSEKEISVIEEFVNAFHLIDQSEDTWSKAGKLSYTMKRKGITANLMDCYLAVIAQENNCKILTLDRHFKDIKKFLRIELV